VIDDSSFNRGSHTQRLMHAAEVQNTWRITSWSTCSTSRIHPHPRRIRVVRMPPVRRR